MNSQSLCFRLSSLFVALSVLFMTLSCVPVSAQTETEEVVPSTFFGEVVPLYIGDQNTMLRASVIDGFNVYQKYNDGTNSYSFDNEIPKGTKVDYMYVQINFPEPVPRQQPFDLIVRFTHNKATGFDPKAMTLYDESENTTKSIKSLLTYEHTDGQTVLTFKNIKVDFIADKCILRYAYSGYSTSAAFIHNVASVNLEHVSDSSLISGIADKISGIIEAITNLPELIANAFGTLFDIVVESLDFVYQAIVDMGDLIVGGLYTLAELLLDGIKSLFVPTQEDIIAIKQNWDTLLEERFGALYEVIGLLDEYAGNFTDTDYQNTIDLPMISIPFGDAIFNFGGQTVEIVPDGFSFILSPIRTITSIIATCLFVNGLRKRFERVVGSE